MVKKYRMTKKDANDLKNVLNVFGIESKVELEDKSNWSINFDFDEKRIQQILAGTIRKASPTGEKLRKQVERHGMAAICLKYGLSERTVYRRLKKEE